VTFPITTASDLCLKIMCPIALWYHIAWYFIYLAFCYFFLAYTLRSMMISAWALFWWAIHVDMTISSAMFLNETWNQTFSFLSSLWQLQAPICRRMTWKMQWTSERWSMHLSCNHSTVYFINLSFVHPVFSFHVTLCIMP